MMNQVTVSLMWPDRGDYFAGKCSFVKAAVVTVELPVTLDLTLPSFHTLDIAQARQALRSCCQDRGSPSARLLIRATGH